MTASEEWLALARSNYEGIRKILASCNDSPPGDVRDVLVGALRALGAGEFCTASASLWIKTDALQRSGVWGQKEQEAYEKLGSIVGAHEAPISVLEGDEEASFADTQVLRSTVA